MKLEDKFDLMQERLDNLTELLQLSINALNTKKSVSQFLNKSEKTIDNYISNGIFKENVHYFRNFNNKVEFIPIGILEFKKQPTLKIKEKEVKKDTVVLSDTSSKILKGLI